ncbi:hypothetical protein ABPG75_011615 [Micractinium tetrahymenae]
MAPAAPANTRLHRCEALPPQQRSPEAASFLQSAQLLQQIPCLLPLNREGRPLAPAPPLHQQALAFALAAAADSISPQAPPLASQLQLGAGCNLAELVTSLLNRDRHGSYLSSLPASLEAQMRTLAAGAGAALLAQAPDSPKACLLAAYCALAADGSFSGGAAARRRALQLYRRAHELARQQRSDYFRVRAACGWLMLAATATNVGSATQASHLDAALAAHQRASSALRRCSRVLPLVWVSTLKGSMAIASQLQPSAEAQLRQLAGRAHAAPPAAAPPQDASAPGKRQTTGTQRRALRSGLVKAAGAAVEAAASAGEAVEAGARCCGCQRTALGLRRCARCHAAWFCSRECQVAAWPLHKLECRCRPASFDGEPARASSSSASPP